MKFNFWKERDKVSEKYFISNCEQTTIVRVLLVAQCGTTVNQASRRVDALYQVAKRYVKMCIFYCFKDGFDFFFFPHYSYGYPLMPFHASKASRYSLKFHTIFSWIKYVTFLAKWKSWKPMVFLNVFFSTNLVLLLCLKFCCRSLVKF